MSVIVIINLPHANLSSEQQWEEGKVLHDWVCSAEVRLGRRVSESLGLAGGLLLPATASEPLEIAARASAQLLPKESSWLKWNGCPAHVLIM